ncbi:transcriptional regulator STERILE APETALA [Prunus yedoensis var. nudiflora]|uniref:Transcriptional regulator STERILE APETALA n=1 Tax=Prunus yedoensis var. nudiflora TaxID=2094558 RepID=A0A314ZQ29_PRUYE|nr:transcriptional regulator STERILE APETALA [Prunus yedoensis var. nudiflora]
MGRRDGAVDFCGRCVDRSGGGDGVAHADRDDRVRGTSPNHESRIGRGVHELARDCLRSDEPGVVLGEEEYRNGREIIVTSVDVSSAAYVIAERRRGLARLARLARVRLVDTMEEVCRFNVRGAAEMGAMGCMNEGYSLMCTDGVVSVWEVERGAYLYRFRERIGDVNAMVCDERHVAACSSDTTLHLWDFGAAD